MDEFRGNNEQRDDGIDPFNLFSYKYNDSSCCNCPISIGIVEVNSLLENDNTDNSCMNPISLGIVDVKKLL